ncbi:hypothetical protein NIES2135_10500 [Leptolyngbya boryana NIES-2135]|jgi:hypothetical protein|uniref:Uncharacterized protein n=1 Tax=Leptolyngbya boryana NIES-2135 TaxID=1973484 RepID=A0A1Z4JBT1_LEPBY|nr:MULTISPECIES: hypothetical protein [Leptolyngbya]BAY54234.1 hypothetical protein NIES2135_10500 [Leptolyngbya boryana NIES-2135]MBN8563297.1 hypothetical protein [Leptolyngbya sp. UWPOB_LEPTO1]ULP31167.1 hypothetical protein MCP04_05295 [Leptolyngbya boryana IU 594]BAS59422.1 DMT(drug/metabolite transporter) superfamily permease [Leptolyngbya boryana IAM M-101]BAS65770.1 DMT(drug/metabolite transporter) superfamily permease [Leptolyngbya boryana dg5]
MITKAPSYFLNQIVMNFRKGTRSHQKVPGQLYLWMAILIFGASSAVTRKLAEIGAIILLGLFFSQIGIRQICRRTKCDRTMQQAEQMGIEMDLGFRGV